MKIVVTALMLFSAVVAEAEEAEEAEGRFPSPDGKFAVVNVRSEGTWHFEVHDRSSKSVYSVLEVPHFEGQLPRAIRVLWTPDSKAVAIEAQIPPDIQKTYVCCRTGEGFERLLIDLAENVFMTPVRWASSSDIVVHVSRWTGDDKGHRSDRPYEHRLRTYRIRWESLEIEKVYESPPTLSKKRNA
jgi:hypothetical protein